MVNEKSPLQSGKEPQPQPYVFTSPQRMYKKKVKQLQCYLCGVVMALFALALLCAILFSVDEEVAGNGGNATDQAPVLYMTQPSGEGPDSSRAPTLGKSAGSKDSIKKLYTSGMVTGGNVTARLDNGPPVDLFAGSLPATISLDSIIDPTAWGSSSKIKWSGVATANNIKGTFSLPARYENKTKTWSGNFSLDLAFKWNGNLDIVEPKKLYDCQVLFINYKKAVIDPKDVLKGKTATDQETCSILLSGHFYEPSFFCYITPWWCTKEQLFYWDGGVELKITEPLPTPSNSSVTPKQILRSEPDSHTKVMGMVTSGTVSFADSISGEKVQVWNGTLPADIDLSIFSTMTSDKNGSYPFTVTWSGSLSESGVQGSFKLPRIMNGVNGWIDGVFSFQVNSTGLSDKLIEGATYKSPVYLHEAKGKFPEYQVDPKPGLKGGNFSIVILGKRVGNSFSWNGRFIAIFRESSVQNSPSLKFVLEASTPGTKILGSVVTGWLRVANSVTGEKTEVWNGTIPLGVSLSSLFNGKATNGSYPLMVSWSCSLFHSTIMGSIDFPKLGIDGEFMFQVSSNAAGLLDRLIPGITYNSPIYFHDSKGQNFSMIPAFDTTRKVTGDKVAIILLGTRIGKLFTWDGQFVAVLHQDEPPVQNNLLLKASHSTLDVIPRIIADWNLGSKILGKATSGWLSVVSDAGVSQTVWNGEIPVNITLPVFWTSDPPTANASSMYSRGVVWSCSAFQSSVRGSFQLPQRTKGGLIKWVRGEFYVQLKPNPQWSFYDIFVPGLNYNSPIHFRDSSSLDVDSLLVPYRTHQEPGANLNGLKAPVILLGKRTKSLFSWEGSFIALVSAVGQ